MLLPLPRFRTALLQWFDSHRRDLPWRRPPGSTTAPLDPYAVLVSEAMLQQTQVATVVPYFRRWMDRFPTVASLAAAEEGEVLRHWQGLGYYSRARNLHRAAKAIMAELGGRVPATVAELRALPGVGPYTAGAIASIAFDQPAPIVDGNVERVVSRLDGLTGDPRTREGKALLWARAGELVPPTAAGRPGDFNSALMELGATLCAPRNPNCLVCPVAQACVAREKGIQNQIPPPKKTKVTPHFERRVYCLRRPDGRYLIEQRPPTGRWAGLWQFPTREPGTDNLSGQPLGTVTHALSHRRYTFQVHRLPDPGFTTDRPAAWVTLDELDRYPLSKPQLTVARLLREADAEPPSHPPAQS